MDSIELGIEGHFYMDEPIILALTDMPGAISILTCHTCPDRNHSEDMPYMLVLC